MAMTLITTNSFSNAASSTFTSSIDSTYKLYIFQYYNCSPATDSVYFSFQGSTDGGSNYNLTTMSTSMFAYHNEGGDDASGGPGYDTAADLTQVTTYVNLDRESGSDANQGDNGELYLFNPSNTTYVKHFYATTSLVQANDYVNNQFVSGYFNTTSAVNAMSFKMSSGNMDGVIKMYGVG